MGAWGSSPRKKLVIFVQNGGILGNTNGYICLDIMPQQEGRLTIFETYCYLIEMQGTYIDLCRYSQLGNEKNCFRI